MDDGSPTMEVGFAIETGGSFDELRQLQAMMDTTEVKVVQDAAKIEKATSGMVKVAGATAAITSFGNAYTKVEQTVSRDAAKIEKSGERLVAQLERQNAAYGKTRAELRAMRVEELASAAASAGNTDLANRLRAQEQDLWAQEYAAARKARLEAEAAAEDKSIAAEKAVKDAEREALAVRQAADAYRMFEAVAKQRMAAYRTQEAEQARAATEREAAATRKAADEHARLAAMVRGSHDAQEADYASLERLRAATDPLYAATKRLNDEIAESTRLYHNGVTPQAEYARQQEVLTGRIRALGNDHDEAAKKIGKSNFAMKQTALQIPDIVSGLATGQKPMMVFFQQGGQIAQIAQMAEGGVKGFAMQIGALALRFTPLIAATAVAGVALYRWKEQINDEAGLKKFADGLGLTHKEMKKLGDTSITTGDLVAGVWKTITDGLGMGGGGKKLLDYLFSPDDAKQVQTFLSQIYGVFVGGYNAIVELWGEIAPAISGFVSRAAAAAAAFFKPLIDAAAWAGNGISEVFSSIYNWVADRVRAMAQWIAPVLSAIGLDKAAAAMSSAGSSIGSTFGKAYSKAAAQFVTGTNNFVASAAANAVTHAQDRLTKKADEIKADRTPKTDRHAEQLVREAEATEAQIRNLYKLADAYKVSDAAALIAEARVKAESAAIKQRGDIEATVDRQVRLVIAQRVSDADKGAAANRQQAAAQEQVNAMVASGLVPAERAGELLKDRIADLPLLAAIEAAQQRGLATEAARATQALEDQRAAREKLADDERKAAALAAKAAGDDRLAELREELRLIGATDAERTHALATLRATQEARKFKPEDQAGYIAQQVQIADLEQQRQLRTDSFNASLTYQADLLDILASNVARAGQGMADAFGEAGRALGDLATSFTAYIADQARLQAAHEAQLRSIRQIRDEDDRARAEQHENALYAAKTAQSQIGMFGDMAASAKGFFKEGSTGYKALADAEKAFRAIQFALSVRAMAQDAIETASSIAKSGARTAVSATEAVVNAIKSLPFPLNIAAGAATIAALAAIGVSVIGSFTGGNKNTLAKANDGTGTVLGDPEAKSASIKNSIDALKGVNDATLTVSRDMLASLRSIESNIGGLATLLVRNGDINADSTVAQGFKTNTIGSILSNIPLIGGFLSSLFGTKTTVIGSGLYGGAQSVGDILNNGFDASYYSDVKKQKKFLGLTTSTKYSTNYTGADADIEAQFALLIKQFYTTIGQAAGPLGQSLDQVQNKLLGFTVNIGKIDLQGLSGDQIKEKLSAVFGAAADSMAQAAVPGLERFQQVGEGYFETLVRVSTTVEQVDASMRKLGATTSSLGIDIDMAIAGMFDSVSDFTNLTDTFFQDFYTKAEQASATTAQMARAFDALGLALPDTMAGFRQLVEAQDLTTEAGRQVYVTLLQLAPAFADLKTNLEGAKSAADILSERQDLETKLLQLTGDTAALRAAELAKLDPSNRALQNQIYAISDAQEAAQKAQDLADAWSSVSDSIMDEVKRIRGLTDAGTGGSFASLLGQFNAATAAARGGDQDAAKSLPGLSQSLLTAAANAATSRQELDRIQAQTAASLEATYGVIMALTGTKPSGATGTSTAASTASQSTTAAAAANDDTASAIQDVKNELTQTRAEMMAALASIAGSSRRATTILENVTGETGGVAVRVSG